jgi:nucleotide-binding universal stress UspA family protein
VPRRILVPLDGSAESEAVLAHLSRLVAAEDEVVFCHCVPPLTPPLGASATEILAPSGQADLYLSDVARRFPRRTVQTRVEKGDPAERLLAVSREISADLIAMTTHARRGLPRFLLGSVAERVTREAAAPVLLVRPATWAPTWPIRQFLVPVDLSAADAGILETVKRLAAGTGAQGVLLHVVPITVVADPGTGFTPMPRGPAPDPGPALEERRRELAEGGLEVRTDVARGDVADHILERVRSLPADVVFMGRARRTGLERWLGGSVTERVLRKAECPVVVRRTAP